MQMMASARLCTLTTSMAKCRSVSFWLFWKCIAWIIELFGSDQESTYLHIFLFALIDELFGNEMLRLSHAWEFCNSLYVLLVLVNSGPANCDSLMELGQSSTSANHSRFPEACLKRPNYCALNCFGVLHLILSRLKLSCEQCSSLFSLTTFTTHSSSDGLDFVCQNSFLRCGQVNSVLCILLRSSMNWWFTFLDFFVSVITSASLALLSKQIVHFPL